MFACLTLLVFTAVLTHAYEQKCTKCADGVESYFDGCNTCFCEDGQLGGCTELACIALARPETTCEGQCDGFMALKSKDSDVRCACKSGKMTNKCTAPSSFGECVTCKTPGVTSFFDGCNQCTCTESGLAACTKKFCIQVESKDCSGKCDGRTAFNPEVNANCVCKNGAFSDDCETNAPRTCKAEGNRVCAADGEQCVDVPRKCLDCAMYDCVDACEAEGNKVCAEDGRDCKVSPKQCITTPCPQFDCVERADACEAEGNKVCGAKGKQCKLSPKQCFTTPCPQYDCVEEADACEAEGNKVCGAKGKQCFLEPKQCITTPCPQYGCRDDECGCDADTPQCNRGKACVNNLCVAVKLPELPEGVADGAPACIRGFGQCCGPNQAFCDDDSICHNNKCIKRDECPAPAEACGCDAAKPRCARGKACVDNKCIDAKLPELPEGVADGAPACIRGFGQCCGPNQSFCDDESVCHNNQCIKEDECAAPVGKECGCGAEKPVCDSGNVCVANRCKPIDFSPFVADGAPGCIRGPVEGQFCCGTSLKSCERGQVCHNDECIDADKCSEQSSVSEDSSVTDESSVEENSVSTLDESTVEFDDNAASLASLAAGAFVAAVGVACV